MTATGARVVPLGRSRRERRRFWRAGLAPYRGDPHHVVPLLADCMDRWAPAHPLFLHAETQHFVALRGGRDVGRIAATVDHRQDATHGDRTGLFGWFETENDRATAHALLDAAAAWLRERGRDRVRGPLSYTTNGIAGLLVRDDRPGPPLVDMPYNPPWYAHLLSSWGLEKARDLIAFWIDTADSAGSRVARAADRLRRRGGFTLRHVRTDRSGFDEDVGHVLRIYNGAWDLNWGFVALTEEEIRHEAKMLRQVLIPELLLFAEKDGTPVAFSLTLPDMNAALGRIRGRLWPWSVLTLLWARRAIRTVRVLTLGVLPEWRRAGLDAALIGETTRIAAELGVIGGECSWILEDNDLMTSGIERAGGCAYRAYRVYERAL